MSNTLYKRCPKCKRLRKWKVPPDHQFADGCHWEKQNGQWICYWCVARQTPDGENKLRAIQKDVRQSRKESRK